MTPDPQTAQRMGPMETVLKAATADFVAWGPPASRIAWPEWKRLEHVACQLIERNRELTTVLRGLLSQGQHDGECDNGESGGPCMRHLVAAVRRESEARAALTEVER